MQIPDTAAIDASTDSIRAWELSDVFLEQYRYAPGPAETIAPHAHADYQLCVSLNTPGEYTYRGTRHYVPARSLSIMHPGERHAARDLSPGECIAEYWVFYISEDVVRRATGAPHPPFFDQAVRTEPALFRTFAALPQRLISASSRLAHDTYLADAFTDLRRHARLNSPKTSTRSSPPSLHRGLEKARERLEDDPAANPSLRELAAVAGLSPARFCRSFHKRFGLPPHAYLLQVRAYRARRLLLAGVPLNDVAHACGYADQSHFNRHFRRYFAASPGRYHRGGKNVQDAPGHVW